jgi:hypothetical protein
VRVGSPSNTPPTAAAAAFYISFFFFSLIPHADNSTLSLVSIVFFSSNFSPSFRDYGGNCLTGGRNPSGSWPPTADWEYAHTIDLHNSDWI